MINRFKGKLKDLIAICRNHSTPKVQPMTANELENIEFRAQTSWPKYYTRGNKYYKFISPTELQLVVFMVGFKAIADRSKPVKHFLYNYWKKDLLEARGYREISETLYHHFYNKVSNRNNQLHLKNIVKPLYDID